MQKGRGGCSPRPLVLSFSAVRGERLKRPATVRLIRFGSGIVRTRKQAGTKIIVPPKIAKAKDACKSLRHGKNNPFRVNIQSWGLLKEETRKIKNFLEKCPSPPPSHHYKMRIVIFQPPSPNAPMRNHSNRLRKAKQEKKRPETPKMQPFLLHSDFRTGIALHQTQTVFMRLTPHSDCFFSTTGEQVPQLCRIRGIRRTSDESDFSGKNRFPP